MTTEEIELYGKSGNDIRPDRVTLKIEEFDFLIEEIKELRKMVAGAKYLRNNPNKLQWNPDGYWFNSEFVGSIENGFLQAGDISGKDQIVFEQQIRVKNSDMNLIGDSTTATYKATF
jgi:hypothetical protein